MGVSALVHLESHFTDVAAEKLRRATYRHLRRHWQFINELILFDIQDQKTFGVNVYGCERDPSFLTASFLYHPSVVLNSLDHDGTGVEPGFKDERGNWDTRAHRSRIQSVTSESLKLWQQILGAESWDSTPMVYSVNSAATRALGALANAERMSSLSLEISRGWDESIDRKKGRFISKWGESDWADAILQGPHMYVSSPWYKSPNPTMKNHLDWSLVDLEEMSISSLPITSFKHLGKRSEYNDMYTRWKILDEAGGERFVAARDFYRVAWRRMAANTGERTLVPALIPPGPIHVNTVMSAAVVDSADDLVSMQAAMSSLLADFFIRSAPKGDIYRTTVERLPRVSRDHAEWRALIQRTLRLNCMTNAYADLWGECWDDSFLDDKPILPRHDERQVGREWTEDVPLRRAVDRRNAQVEIDALVALMFGVPVEDLCTIYRTQFAVLYGYDQREYTYDTNGRLVPNSVLQKWRKRDEPAENAGMPVEERQAEHPGSGVVYTYELPFGTLDREADFRTAYAEFERRLVEAERGPA